MNWPSIILSAHQSEAMENKAKKQTMGRRKIEIKKIERRSSLLVTFSKRRLGLFKKANELSRVCGADVALIVESPGKKFFTWGSPTPDTVIDRYISSSSSSSLSPPPPPPLEKLDAETEISAVKIETHNIASSSQGRYWWNKSIDDLGLEELEEFKAALEGLKSKIMARANHIAMDMPVLNCDYSSSTSSLLPNYYAAIDDFNQF